MHYGTEWIPIFSKSPLFLEQYPSILTCSIWKQAVDSTDIRVSSNYLALFNRLYVVWQRECSSDTFVFKTRSSATDLLGFHVEFQ